LLVEAVVSLDKQARHDAGVTLNQPCRIRTEASIVRTDFNAMENANATLLTFSQYPLFTIL
jgi:hypothetical protein